MTKKEERQLLAQRQTYVKAAKAYRRLGSYRLAELLDARADGMFEAITSMKALSREKARGGEEEWF